MQQFTRYLLALSALLEAMSYGLSVLVSDIPANKESCGNTKELGERMASLLKRRMTVEEKEAFRARIAADYDWRQIAGKEESDLKGALPKPRKPLSLANLNHRQQSPLFKVLSV